MLHTFFDSLFVRLSSVKDFNDLARGSFGIDVISPLSGDVEKRHRLFQRIDIDGRWPHGPVCSLLGSKEYQS